jgi:hypothetical protein
VKRKKTRGGAIKFTLPSGVELVFYEKKTAKRFLKMTRE